MNDQPTDLERQTFLPRTHSELRYNYNKHYGHNYILSKNPKSWDYHDVPVAGCYTCNSPMSKTPFHLTSNYGLRSYFSNNNIFKKFPHLLVVELIQ